MSMAGHGFQFTALSILLYTQPLISDMLGGNPSWVNPNTPLTQEV